MYMLKQNPALNNLLGLICRKIQPTNLVSTWGHYHEKFLEKNELVWFLYLMVYQPFRDI